MAQTNISNNKRAIAQKKALLRRNNVALLKLDNNAKRPLMSTLTHSTREVAEHFVKWRDSLKKSMIGHNGGPKNDD
jgi:hypothetical protein